MEHSIKLQNKSTSTYDDAEDKSKISRPRLIQLLMSKSKVSRSRRIEVLEKSNRNQGRLLTGLNAQRRIPTFLSWALTVSWNIEDDESLFNIQLTVSWNIEDDESLFNIQSSPAIERLEIVLLPLADTCIVIKEV